MKIEKTDLLKEKERLEKENKKLKEQIDKTIGEDLSERIIEMENVYVDFVRKRDKEIEKLNNIINNTKVELEILLQSEDFELIIMQLRNIVFRLKGSDKDV